MANILSGVNEKYPVDEMIESCTLEVTGVDSSSSKLRFQLKLVARVIQKGDVYSEDQYYFTVPQDVFVNVINQYASSLGIQEEIDDLGDEDDTYTNDYFSGEWSSYQLYIRIKYDSNFDRDAKPLITLYNGQYYFDISVNIIADAFYVQNVVYYGVNGNAVGSTSVDLNNTFTLPATTITSTGYRSNGWYTSRTGGNKAGNAGSTSSFISFTGYDYKSYINTDLNLYEQQVVNTYYVRYNGNGGTAATTTSNTVNYGTTITLSTARRGGYKFLGWYTASSGGTRVGGYGDTYTVTAYVTLYAQWSAVLPLPMKRSGAWVPTTAPVKVSGAWRDVRNGYTKVAGVWRLIVGSVNRMVILNANGASGTYSAFGTGTYTVPSNTFSRSGYRFSHWNTKADGTGTTYAPGATFDLSANTTLYAIWVKTYTITWYKIYNHDFPTVYPPSSNSGPVSKDGSNYYLRCDVNGVDIGGLGDNFTVDDKYSPTRTKTVDAGSSLYIQLINKYDADNCTVYLNGTVVSGPSEYVYYTYPGGIQSDMTITFTWESSGTVISNPQSWWDARITTS